MRDEELLQALYPQGQRYVVVFKQGFKKTNVHAVEFLYLLQMHTTLSEENYSRHLQIVSSRDIKESANQYLPIINESKTEEEKNAVLSTFVKYFSNKAVVDFNMTTATLFVPEGAKVDFRSIVAESGYIHSLGNYIYSGDLQSVKPTALAQTLRYAIELAKVEREKVMIVPYFHEDFTHRDRTKSMFLSEGLDDIKFHMSKAYVGQERLYKFLSEFVELHDEDVCMAPTNYEISREMFRGKFPDHNPSAVWIITDFCLRDDELVAASQKNILAYRQTFKNENFYHFYEENKPAWASHTTLPHTLAGAMLNLARRWLPAGDVLVCDPFSGSGTVFLEAQKFTGLRCKSFDLSNLNVEVLGDNIRFFQADATKLREIDHTLAAFEVANAADPFAKKGSVNDIFRSILDVVKQWRSSLPNEDFLSLERVEVEEGLGKVGKDLGARIALYCALRAAVRGSVDLDRDISTWDEIFKREVGQLRQQMKNHIKELDQVGGSVQKDSITVGQGSYSRQVLPPLPTGESNDLFSLKEFGVADVKDLPSGMFDAIICDPPYGFNTEEDRISIVSFAEMLVERLVEGLKPSGGQILMALPKISYTGREIPLPLRSDQIARRLIDYCLRTGRQCWKPALVLPCPLTDFIQPPYYWRSEKALVRRILHFWIYPRSDMAA